MSDKIKEPVLRAVRSKLKDDNFWRKLFDIADREKTLELANKVADILKDNKTANCLCALYICMEDVLYSALEDLEQKDEETT
jgi:hypothetical protein